MATFRSSKLHGESTVPYSGSQLFLYDNRKSLVALVLHPSLAGTILHHFLPSSKQGSRVMAGGLRAHLARAFHDGRPMPVALHFFRQS